VRAADSFCALFPLTILPLPGERINLHIFEPRYQKLFDMLESAELEEFGIPFFSSDPKQKGMLFGGMMRLIFSTQANEDGERDAMIQCVDLFKIDPSTIEDAKHPSNFPSGPIQRLSQWEDWMVPNVAQKEAQLLTKLNTEYCNPPSSNRIIDWMIHFQFAKEDRWSVLHENDSLSRSKSFAQILRFKRIIAEQIASSKGGQFLN